MQEGNVAVERLKMTTMSEAVKSRIYACLTNTKLGQQAMDQSVPNPSFSIAGEPYHSFPSYNHQLCFLTFFSFKF